MSNRPETPAEREEVSMADERWYCMRTGARPAAENMAVDEALLTSSSKTGRPILRFYGWSEPAASFGYFQHYDAVAKTTPLRPLVRRPTGGGIVPHDNDWTYSLIFPPCHAWYALKAIESYRTLHRWVQSAFSHCGLSSELAQVAQKSTAGQCFAGPERLDVVMQGRKIAGAAQRRSRDGLLIQGSVQPPDNAQRGDWEKAMLAVAIEEWQVKWEDVDLPEMVVRQAKALATEKYTRREYNERR